MPFNEWATAKIHYADNDPIGGTYSEAVIVAGIATGTNYDFVEVGLIAPQHRNVSEGEAIRDISGEVLNGGIPYRGRFDVELYPFDYADSSSYSVADWDAIEAILRTKANLWIEFSVTERAYHTAGNAIPVVLDGDPEITIEKESGTRLVTLPLLRKWRA